MRKRALRTGAVRGSQARGSHATAESEADTSSSKRRGPLRWLPKGSGFTTQQDMHTPLSYPPSVKQGGRMKWQ